MTSPPSSERDGRLMGSFTMGFSRGLLILRDKSSVSTHDHWDPSTFGIDVEADSIYLGVLNAVDGLVEVNFIDGGEPDEALLGIHQGDLEVASGRP